MVPLLLLAGLSLTTVDVGEAVVEARVADVDADGREDIVAVTRTRLLLLRGGEEPVLDRPAPPLTVLGTGLLAVVREGRLREVTDPFGAFEEGPPGPLSVLAALGRSEPALLRSPGDLDGDGRDDPILATPEGFHTPLGPLPLRHEARLEIFGNETFAVEYSVPVPVVGRWTGGRAREVVLFHDDELLSFAGSKRTDRVPLPLSAQDKGTAALRRNHVHVRDMDGDGRLDLLVVMARGSTGLFGAFEASVRLFAGGRVYDHGKKGFHRPVSFLKVPGALLAADPLDLDGDGDVDLALSTIDTSILASASGTAPGIYFLFVFEDGGFVRNPRWTFRAPVPLSAFQERPDPPVTFLPDLDRDGRPEAILRGDGVRILEAGASDSFRGRDAVEFEAGPRPAHGSRLAVVAGPSGLLVLRGGE